MHTRGRLVLLLATVAPLPLADGLVVGTAARPRARCRPTARAAETPQPIQPRGSAGAHRSPEPTALGDSGAWAVGEGVCAQLGNDDEMGYLCDDAACTASDSVQVWLCTAPADAPPGPSCILQPGLFMSGQPVWACGHP